MAASGSQGKFELKLGVKEEVVKLSRSLHIMACDRLIFPFFAGPEPQIKVTAQVVGKQDSLVQLCNFGAEAPRVSVDQVFPAGATILFRAHGTGVFYGAYLTGVYFDD